MKQPLIASAIVAVLALLSGCAKTMQLDDPQLYDQYLTRSYNQRVDVCYNAVLTTFKDRGVDLTKADPIAGRIVTEKHVAAIYAGYGVVGTISHRYYIDVKGDTENCTIKITKYKAWKGDNEVPYVKVDDVYSYYWAPLFGGFESNFDEDEDDAIRTRAEMDAVMKQHRPELDEIYNQYLKKTKKKFEGYVALKFTIAPKGNIIDISIEATTTGELDFDQLIKAAVSTWNFGEVSGANMTRIVTFNFSADNNEDSSKNGGRRAHGDGGDKLDSLLKTSGDNGSGGIGGSVGTAADDDVNVNGKRKASDIMKVVEQRKPALRNIYNKYRKKNPEFEGRIVVKFTIDANGDVVKFSILSSTTNNAKFDGEIKKVISGWKFGKVEVGNTTATIPFTFAE